MIPIENIAGSQEYQQYLDKFAYIFTAGYFVKTELIQLPLGYEAAITHYNHTFDKAKNVTYTINCQEISLRDEARQVLFSYQNAWGDPFFDILEHRNGQVYFICGNNLTEFALYNITKKEAHPFVSRCRIDPRYCLQEDGFFWYVSGLLYHPQSNLLIFNGKDNMNCDTAVLCDFSNPEVFPYRSANLSSYTWQTYDDGSCYAFKWDEDGRLHLDLEERSDPVVVDEKVLQELLTQ